MFSTLSFTKRDDVLHVGTHSSLRMSSFFSGYNRRFPDGVVNGYAGSTWAGLMRAQASRVAVGGRYSSATIKEVGRTSPSHSASSTAYTRFLHAKQHTERAHR